MDKEHNPMSERMTALARMIWPGIDTNDFTKEGIALLKKYDQQMLELYGRPEPVSEDFKTFEEKYFEENKEEIVCIYDRHAGLVDGAQWQQEQFEKNRLAACDAQTPEEAEREMNFVEHIIKEEHRQPTYSDAIEYGMRLQKQKDNQDDSDMAVIAHLDGVESGKAIMKEQMMKEAVEGIIIISHGEKVLLHPSRHGKAEMSLPDEIIDKYGIDDKVKIIFIKEV